MDSIFGKIDDLYLFCCVVEEGSLLGASNKLHLPVSTLSRRLSTLEAKLGVRLLEKQGRALVPTHIGKQAFVELSRGMELIESGLQSLGKHSHVIEGSVKVVMPYRFYHYFIGDVIRDFMREYPRVTMDLVFSQEFSIPETDRDLVITFDIQDMEGMIARSFFQLQNAFFVSPQYIQKNGSIECLDQFHELDWISVNHDRDMSIYEEDKFIKAISVKPRWVINDMGEVIRATEQGFGIASLPLRYIDESLNLIRVLPQYHRGCQQSYLVYKERTYQPRALTLLIEALMRAVSNQRPL